MSTTPLPPLPDPTWSMPERLAGEWSVPGAWSSSQMQAYAQQARADLEAVNHHLRDVLRQAESKLIELEQAVSGGDDEIYVEGVILSIRAALKGTP